MSDVPPSPPKKFKVGINVRATFGDVTMGNVHPHPQKIKVGIKVKATLGDVPPIPPEKFKVGIKVGVTLDDVPTPYRPPSQRNQS